EVNSLNTILAIAIMFICCNGKILIFTEINNSKRGYPTFWTAPYNFVFFVFSGETGSITYHFKQYHKLVIYC
ncbi:hypothetical protein ACIXFH_22940, partial [Bacteroides fragilis]